MASFLLLLYQIINIMNSTYFKKRHAVMMSYEIPNCKWKIELNTRLPYSFCVLYISILHYSVFEYKRCICSYILEKKFTRNLLGTSRAK